MTDCPCCSYQMLQHIRSHQTVWFCRYCRQTMPDLTAHKTYSLLKTRSLKRIIKQRFMPAFGET